MAARAFYENSVSEFSNVSNKSSDSRNKVSHVRIGSRMSAFLAPPFHSLQRQASAFGFFTLNQVHIRISVASLSILR